MAIVNPGDEVIIPAPFWLSYAEMVRIAGGTPVIAYTKAENNFELSREVLESAYTEKTKAVIVTTPSNPTGMVLTEKCLREIADFAVEKDIIVIADEIYEKLIYSKDKKHISIASFGKEIYERTDYRKRCFKELCHDRLENRLYSIFKTDCKAYGKHAVTYDFKSKFNSTDGCPCAQLKDLRIVLRI